MPLRNHAAINRGQALTNMLRATLSDIKTFTGLPGKEVEGAKEAIEKELKGVYERWLQHFSLKYAFFHQHDVGVRVKLTSTSIDFYYTPRLSSYLNGEYSDHMEPLALPLVDNPHEPDPKFIQKTKFGFDVDGTMTRDWIAFLGIILFLRSRGHLVYVVTMRDEQEGADIPDQVRHNCDGIYCTNRQGKNEYMLRQGISIDVWIDDNPRAVYMPWSEVAKEKANDPRLDG